MHPSLQLNVVSSTTPSSGGYKSHRPGVRNSHVMKFEAIGAVFGFDCKIEDERRVC